MTVRGADADLAVAEPRRLGRYVLRYRVADGGMGAVYLAQIRASDGFEKWVAVKVVHEHVARDANFVRMFMDEARIAARLNHPNVAQVFDSGEDHGAYYLAMEYLHGEPLNSVLKAAWREDTMPAALAARIVADAARGLHAAHELKLPDGTSAGIVHRDVSPQNVFVLYDGATRIVDFGIARSNDRTADRTATDVLKGKIGYMAPEQVARQPFDRRVDIWALGVVLWEASLGRRLFKHDSEIATLIAVANDPIPAPTSLRADYPPALSQIVMRALERAPERRYATAGEMARDLERYLATLGVPTGSDEVADFMRAKFAERIQRRDALLADGGADDGEVASVELHSNSSLSRRALDEPAHAPTAPATPKALVAPQSKPRVGGMGLLAIVAVLCVGSVAGLWIVLHPSSHPAPVRDAIGVRPDAAIARVEPPSSDAAAVDAARVAIVIDAGHPASIARPPMHGVHRPRGRGPQGAPLTDMNGAL